MNATVAKIVELLFQDVEMSDEVKAIHDEVMDNSQERFVDLLGRGLNEDEAIAAVVESLKGMEEVLAAYPRKAAKAQDVDTPAEDMAEVLGESVFSAARLRQINVNVLGEDLTIEPSPDHQVHVISNVDESDKKGRARIRAEIVDGELRVSRVIVADNGHYYAGNWDGKRFEGFAREFSSKEFSWENLGDMIGRLVHNVQIHFDEGEDVRIQVPVDVHLEQVRVNTNSGDVGIEGLKMDMLELMSRSGDLRVELPGTHMLRKASLHTVSGDVEVWLAAEQISVQSMSGDVRFVGRAQVLSVNSTSGDVTVESVDGACESCELRSVSGDVECSGNIRQVKASTTSGNVSLNAASERMAFASVSGDVDVKCVGGALRLVDGHTTSGDVAIHFAEGAPAAEINVRSTSGDVSQLVASMPGAPLQIRVNTVSGDVRIR